MEYHINRVLLLLVSTFEAIIMENVTSVLSTNVPTLNPNISDTVKKSIDSNKEDWPFSHKYTIALVCTNWISLPLFAGIIFLVPIEQRKGGLFITDLELLPAVFVYMNSGSLISLLLPMNLGCKGDAIINGFFGSFVGFIVAFGFVYIYLTYVMVSVEKNISDRKLVFTFRIVYAAVAFMVGAICGLIAIVASKNLTYVSEKLWIISLVTVHLILFCATLPIFCYLRIAYNRSLTDEQLHTKSDSVEEEASSYPRSLISSINFPSFTVNKKQTVGSGIEGSTAPFVESKQISEFPVSGTPSLIPPLAQSKQIAEISIQEQIKGEHSEKEKAPHRKGKSISLETTGTQYFQQQAQETPQRSISKYQVNNK